MHTYMLSLFEPPPAPATPSLWVITEHPTELPALHSSYPLAVQFTQGGCVCVSPTLPVTPSPSVFYGCVSILALYHFSRFCIYVC